MSPASSPKPRYKTPGLQSMYEAMLAAAADPKSELYHEGKPRRGAGHRAAFWDGYAELKRTANVIPGTYSAACFAAGRAFARTHPGIAVQDAVWTPGVSRQGERTPLVPSLTRGLPHAG